jgi:hypothetical protein
MWRTASEDAEPALEQHEAHLRNGGPAERDLHAGLGQHHGGAEERGEPPDHRQKMQRGRREKHDVGEPDDEEPARVDDARVQQGGDGRGRLHNLRQPAVCRELGRLEKRGGSDQKRRSDDARRGLGERARCLEDRGDVGRPERPGDQNGGADQAGIAEAGADEFLARREHGLRPIRVEEQQAVQGEARRDPGQHELRKIAGQNEQHDRRQRQAEPPREHALPRISVQVVAAEFDDDRADEGDQQEHDDTQGVQPDGQPDAVGTEERGGCRPSPQHDRGSRDGRHERAERGQPGRKERPARAQAGIERGDESRRQQSGGRG